MAAPTVIDTSKEIDVAIRIRSGAILCGPCIFNSIGYCDLFKTFLERSHTDHFLRAIICMEAESKIDRLAFR